MCIVHTMHAIVRSYTRHSEYVLLCARTISFPLSVVVMDDSMATPGASESRWEKKRLHYREEWRDQLQIYGPVCYMFNAHALNVQHLCCVIDRSYWQERFLFWNWGL